MLCRSISWFFCTFVAVATATRYSSEDYISVPVPELGVHHLTTDNPESATAETVSKVEPSGVVDLGALLDAREDALVTLVAGDTRLVAHRAVLAARSPAFQRILRNAGPGEVAIPDVEGPVLRQLLAYLYTLPALQLPGTSQQLLDAADQYGLSALKVDCKQHDAAQPSLDTEAAAAATAVRMSCYSLREAAVAYIRAHIFHVMATRGWSDATERQQEAVTTVTQLVSDSLAETRSLPPEEKGSSLREAAAWGALGELAALLAAETVGAWGPGQETALHLAADQRHAAEMRLLLAAGAPGRRGARDVDARTPLHSAAERGYREAAEALLEGGADRAARDSGGETALDVARRFRAGSRHTAGASPR